VAGRSLVPVRQVTAYGGSYDVGRLGRGSGGFVLIRPLGFYDVADQGADWVAVRSRPRRLVILAAVGMVAAATSGTVFLRRGRSRRGAGSGGGVAPSGAARRRRVETEPVE
jgi:hypothetical protein